MAPFIEEVKLFSDGGCRGNPGPGAIGLLIMGRADQELDKRAECIGNTTNNRAEYNALIRGLDLCAKHTRGHVVCFMDSQLVVNQMTGTWRLKNEELRSLYYEVRKRELAFKGVTYQYVERTNPYMKKVDRLLNEAFEGR